MGESGAGGGGGEVTREELAQMLLDALMRMDRDELRRLAAMAVTRSRAWSPGARSAGRTTSTGRCGSSTSTTSAPA